MAKEKEPKKVFPKARPMGRNVLPEPIIPTETVTPEAAVEPAVKKFVKVTLDDSVKPPKSHIHIEGLNPFESLAVLKNAHKYLFEALKKEVEQLNGIEEGPTDTASGGNS